MNQSRDSAIIPLGSEPQIRLQYVNFTELVRFGKLLEDLDTFASMFRFIRSIRKRFNNSTFENNLGRKFLSYFVFFYC